ncbi:MAG: DUF4176 domain-containing protein [Clostridium paraputrificum]
MNNIFNNQLKLSFIDKKSKDLNITKEITTFFVGLAENNLFTLKDILGYIKTKKTYINSSFHLELTFIENTANINTDTNKFHIAIEKFKRLIVSMIDLFEVIYPLGTVVNLKTEYLNQLTNNNEIEEATFVITSRYVYTDDVKTYFQYGGIPYPVGDLGLNKVFYFTSDLIREVLTLGYTDDREEAYIYMMKKELLLDGDYISIGYAPKEERKKLELKLREIK